MWNTSLLFHFYTYSKLNYCCCLPLLKVKQLTAYCGCISLFCHLKMCVSCAFLGFKGVVITGRWVRLSREMASDYEVGCIGNIALQVGTLMLFPEGEPESHKRIQTNGTKRMISCEYSAWSLLAHTCPQLHSRLSYWKVYYFMVPELCPRSPFPFFFFNGATYYESSSKQFTHVEITLFIYPQQGNFLRMKRGTELISWHYLEL